MINNELLAIVARTTSSSVLITDSTRRIVWVNQAFCEISGYSEGEVIGLSPAKLLQGPESDQQTIKDIRASLQEGRPFDGEILNYTKDKSPYWIRLVIDPVCNDAGEITHFIGIQYDITQRKVSEQLLSDTNQRLALATTRAGIGVWDYDPKQNRLIWDDNMFELYQVDPASFQGNVDDWGETVHPDDLGPTVQALERLIEADEPFDCLFRIISSDKPRWIHAIASLYGMGMVHCSALLVSITM